MTSTEREAEFPMCIALTDGRIGNQRQALALAEALHWPTRHLVIRPCPPWRWVAPRCWPGANRALGLEFRTLASQPPPYAIGCGRQSALATRLLRRAGSRAIQILNPRLRLDHWDWVVAPEHDGLTGANVISLIGSLHPVNDIWLAQARAQFARWAALPRPRITFLVGGPTTHARWTADAFEHQCQTLDRFLRRSGGSLLTTVSRRTPDAVRQCLRIASEHWPGLFWAGQSTHNPYPGMLAWADCIVCTPDSVNMISEACATHVPVFIWNSEIARGRLQRFIRTLLDLRRIRAADAALEAFPVTALRETERVADTLREQLGETALS